MVYGVLSQPYTNAVPLICMAAMVQILLFID